MSKLLTRDFSLGLSGVITAPIGYAVLLFLPIYLEVAASTLGLDASQVGVLASTDASGLALATLFFSLWVKKLNFHTVAIVGVSIAVVANLVSIAVMDDYFLLCSVRVVAGLGEGMMVAVGVSAVGMTQNPNRWFGIYTMMIVLVQGIGLLVVPPAYDLWGLSGVYLLIIAVYTLPLCVVKILPINSISDIDINDESVGSKNTISSQLLILALFGLLLFYVCIGGVWAYLSFMGTDSGLSLEFVSKALSIGLLGGLSGAAFFAILGRLGANHILLFISSSVIMLCLWNFNNINDGSTFIVTLLIFNFFWSIVGARLFAVISDADYSGKYISAAQTVVGFGFVVGPLLGAILVIDYGYSGVNFMGIVSLVLCFLAVSPLVFKTKKIQLSNVASV